MSFENWHKYTDEHPVYNSIKIICKPEHNMFQSQQDKCIELQSILKSKISFLRSQKKYITNQNLTNPFENNKNMSIIK